MTLPVGSNYWPSLTPLSLSRSFFLSLSLSLSISLFLIAESGTVEACWTHNPDVRGSKRRSGNILQAPLVRG